MTIPRIAVFGLAVIIAALAVLWGVGAWQQSRGARAETQSSIYKGEADALEAQARKTDPKVEDLKAKLSASTARENRLLAERDALLRRVATLQRGSHGPDSHGTAPPAEPGVGADAPSRADFDALVELVTKDTEVIEELQASSTVKDSLIVQLTESRDEWKAAAEARERQAMAQAEATKAWKQAVTSSKWVGRAQGFAAGVALGYIGARR